MPSRGLKSSRGLDPPRLDDAYTISRGPARVGGAGCHPRIDAERFTEDLDGWASGDTSPEAARSLLEAARTLLGRGRASDVAATAWHRYLDLTRRPTFLQALPDRGHRHAWAETTFELIPLSGYTLETMLAQRVAEHPDRSALPGARRGPDARAWSYDEVSRRLKRAGRHSSWPRPRKEPRVAILSGNSLEGACCDLACLTYGILVTPLEPAPQPGSAGLDPPHPGRSTSWSPRPRSSARTSRRPSPTSSRGRKILLLHSEARLRNDDESTSRRGGVAARGGRGGPDPAHEPSRPRPPRPGHGDVHLREHRDAERGLLHPLQPDLQALSPEPRPCRKSGNEEVLLSYLPLFHTFGRYLEMMGMLFWGGTYVFAGNPSLESLLAGLREIRPDGPHQHPPPVATDPRAGPGGHGGGGRGDGTREGVSGDRGRPACVGASRLPGAWSRRRSDSSTATGWRSTAASG